MTVTFEGVIQEICEELQISSADRISYTKEAEEIRNYLMERMKASDVTFSQAFNGLSLTGSYLDDLKINLPDEFDYHMKLKFPFEAQPIVDPKRPGCVFLKAKKTGLDPASILDKNGFVDCEKLQSWIRDIMLSAIGDGGNLVRTSNGRTYKLLYPKNCRGYGVAHTVVAVDIRDKLREISFDFAPVFEFDAKDWPFSQERAPGDHTWFAVPIKKRLPDAPAYDVTFMVCAPHLEREVIKDKDNLKNSLRLMKALRNAKMLGRLSSYMLKSVYLQEVERNSKFWQQATGKLLVHMLHCLIKCIESGDLPFYLDEDLNHLNLLDERLQAEYLQKLKALTNNLEAYEERSSLPMNWRVALMEMFGIK